MSSIAILNKLPSKNDILEIVNSLNNAKEICDNIRIIIYNCTMKLVELHNDFVLSLPQINLRESFYKSGKLITVTLYSNFTIDARKKEYSEIELSILPRGDIYRLRLSFYDGSYKVTVYQYNIIRFEEELKVHSLCRIFNDVTNKLFALCELKNVLPDLLKELSDRKRAWFDILCNLEKVKEGFVAKSRIDLLNNTC